MSDEARGTVDDDEWMVVDGDQDAWDETGARDEHGRAIYRLRGDDDEDREEITLAELQRSYGLWYVGPRRYVVDRGDGWEVSVAVDAAVTATSTSRVLTTLDHLLRSTDELREPGDLAELHDAWAEAYRELRDRLRFELKPRHEVAPRDVEVGTSSRYVTDWEADA